MTDHKSIPPSQTLSLARGGQAIINGALVTASEQCTIEVGSGAFVLAGRGLWRDQNPLRHPREELYFSLLDAAADDARYESDRFRLFSLLSQVVAQERTHWAQKECTLIANAMMSSELDLAVRGAARLASGSLERDGAMPGSLPGRLPVRRSGEPCEREPDGTARDPARDQLMR
ncbi:hypothetical protein [Qipengyuania nanhaisediminis]|uniref:hypothetical protein n=1 Tax=Qipengyuania nanhaisediminis TaxID=604088 RepID=UPI0038B39539